MLGDGTTLGASGARGNAVAVRYKMPEEGFGATQWLMIASVGLLLGVIVVPPLVSGPLRGGGGHVG